MAGSLTPPPKKLLFFTTSNTLVSAMTQFSVRETFCQVLSDGMHLRADCFFFSQRATHDLAFLVHLAVLSVGGVRGKRGGQAESVSSGS